MGALVAEMRALRFQGSKDRSEIGYSRKITRMVVMSEM